MNNIGISVHGGLGNQLFKIFTIISYCIDNCADYVFYIDINGDRKYYWNTLFSNIGHKVSNEKHIAPPDYNYSETPNCYSETPNIYNKIPIFNNDTFLNGYFQNHKYFEHNINKIKDIIEIDEKINNVLIKYPEYTSNKTISVHYRMGDYKRISGFPIKNTQYYIDSFKTLINRGVDIYDYEILYFCEEEDHITVSNYNIEINDSLKELTGKDLRYKKVSDAIYDLEQLFIMTSAKHYIICNSTFSWFGAYLSSSNDSIVCYPEFWFGDQPLEFDIGLNNWIKMVDK